MRGRLLPLLAVAPAVALAVLSVVATAAQPFGGGLWPPDEVTLPEAAATGNAAEVLRLLALGENPNLPARVRREVVNDPRATLTAFEAALLEGEPEVAALLLQRGASPTAAQVRDLWCSDRLSADSRAVLAPLSAGALLECPGRPASP
jgi:hypothetical protein